VLCRNAETRPEILEDYVSGALPATEAATFETHLQGCAECREQVEVARQAGQLLRAAYEPAAQPSGAFWTRLRAQLREEESRLATGGDFWSAVEQLAWRLSFGAAALVVLLVGVVIGTQLPGRTPETPGTYAEARDIFPEPVQAMDGNDVLLELASGKGRLEGKR